MGGMGSGRRRRPASERFWEKVDKTDSCWIWTGKNHARKMYPTFNMNVGGTSQAIQRVAWEFTHGPVPAGCSVVRTCRNRLCVNPEHLKLQKRPRDLAERFWGSVNKTDTCWLWTGGMRSGTGLPSFRESGCEQIAYRVSWLLVKGEIPDDYCVRQRCGEVLCVNPDHLYLLSKVDTGRQTVVKSSKVKIDRARADEIRRRYEKGDITQTALAREFGVSQPLVSQILNGRHWS